MVMHLFNSCNKFDVRTGIENNKRDVFEIPPSAPNALVKIVAELKRQNELTGFLKDFVIKEGYPLWDKSIYQKLEKNNPAVFNTRGGEEVADTVVYTPIALLDSNFVNGFLLSKVFGDSVELHLYRANDYDLYPYGGVDGSVLTAEFITLKLIELNDAAFGKNKYEVKDSFLFRDFHNGKPNFIRTVIEINLDSSVAGKYAFFPACFETLNCYCLRRAGNCDGDHKCLTTGCDRCYWCIDVDCTTIALPGGGAGGGSTPNWPPDPPTNPGGGGGNNPPAPTNCTGVNECRPGSQIVEGKVPCGGCGSGPIVVIPPEFPTVPQIITFDSTFLNSKLKCQLDSLKKNDAFFSNLLNTFDGIESNLLSFQIGNVPNGIAAITKGLGNLKYVITISKDIDTSSNLIRMLILTHELIHAKLFYSLEKAGVLSFNHNGDPILDSTAGLSSTQVNLNQISEVDGFRLTIKRYNGTYVALNYPPELWTHSLFNMAYFDNGNTYRQKIENLLYDNGDWDNQPLDYKNFLQNRFYDWKRDASKSISWEGLQFTPQFNSYLNSFDPDMTRELHDSIIIVTKYQSTNICP